MRKKKRKSGLKHRAHRGHREEYYRGKTAARSAFSFFILCVLCELCVNYSSFSSQGLTDSVVILLLVRAAYFRTNENFHVTRGTARRGVKSSYSQCSRAQPVSRALDLSSPGAGDCKPGRAKLRGNLMLRPANEITEIQAKAGRLSDVSP